MWEYPQDTIRLTVQQSSIFNSKAKKKANELDKTDGRTRFRRDNKKSIFINTDKGKENLKNHDHQHIENILHIEVDVSVYVSVPCLGTDNFGPRTNSADLNS